MPALIEIEDLTKTFGSVRALDGFDMTVGRGEVSAFLGPNGAGKSTAIRVLLGLLRADSGSISVLGRDPWRDAVELHERLVYVPGDVSLWPQLTGGEIIDVLHRMRGDVSVRRRDDLIERFELDPTKRARTYSKGNRQKVALIAALACEVDLYVLDEPTSGLDPLVEAAFADQARRLADDGRTVLLSSHVLAEVEKLSDTVTIIRDGRTVQAGALSDLRHLTRDHVTVTVREGTDAIADLDGVHDLEVGAGNTVSFTLDREHTATVMRALAALDIVGIVSNPPSLEELFLRHYRHERSGP